MKQRLFVISICLQFTLIGSEQKEPIDCKWCFKTISTDWKTHKEGCDGQKQIIYFLQHCNEPIGSSTATKDQTPAAEKDCHNQDSEDL